MSTYKARFTAQATVVVELTVTAKNQEEGLVAAHDLVGAADISQAKVVGIHPGTFVNEGFERIESAPPLSGIGAVSDVDAYLVHVYREKDCKGSVLFSLPAESREGAKSTLKSLVSSLTSPVCSGRVVDAAGAMVMEANASRGGWEVEVEKHDEPLARITWLGSQSEALKTAAMQIAVSGVKKIRILDYSVRAAGPKLWKEIG